ncbi:ribonuclease HI [Prolixibacteraceae bacterium]|nr:ribonuclease HI [Prolixibacteraceae bacterium]
MNQNDVVVIYTDGASRGNPGPGGYGTILMYKQHRKEMSGGFRKTTNNRMELLAVIVGLEALKREGLNVVVYSDSKYVVDSIEKKWVFGWVKKRFKDKKNADLWMRLLPLYAKHQVKMVWIKGHANNIENENCDRLAVEAALGNGLIIDQGYESSVE